MKKYIHSQPFRKRFHFNIFFSGLKPPKYINSIVTLLAIVLCWFLSGAPIAFASVNWI